MFASMVRMPFAVISLLHLAICHLPQFKVHSFMSIKYTVSPNRYTNTLNNYKAEFIKTYFIFQN